MIPVSKLFEKVDFKAGKTTKDSKFIHHDVKDKPSTSDIKKDKDGSPMIRTITPKDSPGTRIRVAIMKKAGPEGGHTKTMSKLTIKKSTLNKD